MRTTNRYRIALVAAGTLLVGLAALGLWLSPALRSRVPLVGHLLGPASTAPAEAYVCPMHPEVRRPGPDRCPACGMDLVPESEVLDAGHAHDHGPASGTTEVPRGPVALDARRQQLIGVRLATAEPATLEPRVRAVGTIALDESRLTDVNVRIEGFVEELFVDRTGVLVARGQPLFTIYSPELVATGQEYLLALAARDRVTAAGGTAADAAYAERLVAAARRRLERWDLPAAAIEELARTRTPRETVLFASPAAGFVVEKRVVARQRVMAGETLYRLADLSTVWLEADVPERDSAFVVPGARANVSVAAIPGETFAARVTLVAPLLDASTRTVRVRFELPNPRLRLRPGMFASVGLAAPPRRVLTVPVDAVIDAGARQFVFVARGEGYFEPRQVGTGLRQDGLVEITHGLEAGEQVASRGAFFLDSESQLRAAMEDYAEPPPPPPLEGQVQASALRIEFRTEPDPPRNGDSGFEVTVSAPDGTPVTDADVQVRLYMAPMPSMNMPAMRTDIALLHAGDGRYRGRGVISMAGRWDVTVTVSRGGARLASRTLGIVAK